MHSITIIASSVTAIAITYLSLGRQISMLVDRFFPGRSAPKPINPMSIDFDSKGVSSRFTLGSSIWPFSWPWPPGPFDLKIILDSEQLVLFANGHSFTFGPVQKKWPDQKYQFTPAPGDIVSLTRDLGRLPWLTPFTFNIMSVPVPKAKRYVYDRLRWTKPSGSMLEITWRGEYWFYTRTGWADTYNNRLHHIRIHPSLLEKSAAAYLSATKGWSANEYRLESQPPDSEDALINAIYLNDESPALHPGAGQSIVLRMNKSSRKVVSEIGWQ